MKRNILFLIFILVFGFIIIPNVYAQDDGVSKVTIIHNGESKDYNNIKTALDALQDGDTIKFLTDIVSKNYGTDEINKTVTIAKNVTVDFNNQKIGLPFVVDKNKTVTFITGPKEITIDNKPVITLEDGAKAIINGGTYKRLSYAPPMVLTKSNSKLEVNNVTLEFSKVFTIDGSNSKIDINNSNIKGNINGFIVTKEAIGNTVNITGGTFKGSYGILSMDAGAKNNTFNFNNVEELRDDLEIKGENNTVNYVDTVQLGASSDYAVSVFGTNNKFTVGGKSSLKAGLGAIYTNSDTATVIINGGTFGTEKERTGGNRLTPVILSRGAKEITINDGTITGQVGIVALKGNININGGTITATNTNKDFHTIHFTYQESYNDDTYKDFGEDIDFYGAAIIADGNDTNINIKSGLFNATTDESIVTTDEKANYSVSGGIYNKPFNEEFVVPNEVELKINDKDLWYVGKDAKNAVNEAKKNSNNKIEVLQGDLTIENAAVGLKVKNSGKGSVVVNGQTVETGKEISAKESPVKEITATTENPNTYDNILLLIVIMVISALGFAFVTKKLHSKI